MYAFSELAHLGINDVNKMRRACNSINTSVTQSDSIDEYMFQKSNDLETQRFSKIAIVNAISYWEGHSSMCINFEDETKLADMMRRY